MKHPIRNAWKPIAAALSLALSLSLLAPQVRAEAMEVQEQGDVRYISGGVSDAEQKEMRDKVGKYDLQMTFAREQDGAYLAGVDVTIRNGKGQSVMQARAQGPMMLADLPDGKYRVIVEADGWETMRRKLKVGDGHQSVHFTLKAQEG